MIARLVGGPAAGGFLHLRIFVAGDDRPAGAGLDDPLTGGPQGQVLRIRLGDERIEDRVVENTPPSAQVRLGRRNPDYIEVLDGLRPGERVITSAYTGFVDKDRLDLE